MNRTNGHVRGWAFQTYTLDHDREWSEPGKLLPLKALLPLTLSSGWPSPHLLGCLHLSCPLACSCSFLKTEKSGLVFFCSYKEKRNYPWKEGIYPDCREWPYRCKYPPKISNRNCPHFLSYWWSEMNVHFSPHFCRTDRCSSTRKLCWNPWWPTFLNTADEKWAIFPAEALPLYKRASTHKKLRGKFWRQTVSGWLGFIQRIL